MILTIHNFCFAAENSHGSNTFDPSNGSTVLKFEGETTNFFCQLFTGNKSESDNQETTIWSILNFNESTELLRIENVLAPSDYSISSGPTENNDNTNDVLTLLHVSTALDEASIVCGTKNQQQVGTFTLRIYSK